MTESMQSEPERVVTTANESGQPVDADSAAPEQTDNTERPEDGPQDAALQPEATE